MNKFAAHSWAGRSLRRYLPAELAGVAVSLAAGLSLLRLTGNPAVAAVAATWGENAGYYGVIAVRDLLADRAGTPRSILRTLGALVVEFGPAEALDSLLFRPFFMFAGLTLTGHPILGIVAGKLAADVLFYAVTIPTRALIDRRRQLPTGGLS